MGSQLLRAEAVQRQLGAPCEGLGLDARGAVRAQLLPLSTMHMLATRNANSHHVCTPTAVTLVWYWIVVSDHEPIAQESIESARHRQKRG